MEIKRSPRHEYSCSYHCHSFRKNSPNMNIDSQNTMSQAWLNRTLVITNIILTFVGYVGGSLTSRLYFLHGGHRLWLSSFLETAAFPLLLLPLSLSYHHRRWAHPNAKPILITPRILAACSALGLMTGADDFLYAYGLSFLPVSTSVLLLSTHLAFTAFFAFLIVKQKFTAYSLNAIALLTMGAVVLGLHASTDRPKGVTKGEYYLGFVLTLGAALLYGLVLPLVELTYRKAEQAITYTLVMEMQVVIGFFGTVLCLVGMIANKDFQVSKQPLSDSLYFLSSCNLLVIFSIT